MHQPDFAESLGLESANTDRLYEALAALRQSEARFRSLCELSSDWYWEQDENFRFTSRSGGTADHAALRPQEDHGKTRWELPAIGVTEAQWQAHRDTLAAHLPFRDFCYQRRDDSGELRTVSVSGHPVFDEHGVFRGYRGIARDITSQVREERLLAQQRKEREEALRESEARFRGLCELSSDWYWEQDAELRFTVMSGGEGVNKGNFRVDKALGRTRWELPIELSEAEWAAHKATLAARQPFTDFEYKILTEDGSMRWYSARGEPLFDEAGNFSGYRGVANDITQRKRRDEELRRFRVAMDTSADSIFLVDRTLMRYIDANATACKVLGYTREQLLAMGPQDMVAKPRDEVERDFDALIAGVERHSRKQATLRRSDGSPLRVEISRRAHQSGDGWIIVGIARDISDRLAAEETIRQHAMQQSLIAAFGQKALANTQLDELLSQAAHVAAEGLGVALCSVLQLGLDGRSLVLKAGLGWEDESIGCRIADRDEPSQTRYVIERAEPVTFDDLARETRFPPLALLTRHGVTSGIDVPIHGVSGPYGVLGAYSREPRHFTQESVNFLQSVANTLATAMDRKGAEERLTYLAQFDTLTGLANRSLFLDRFAQTLKQAKRNDWSVGVLFVDLDRFKLVNDTLGHSIGDQLLVQVARRLQECVRAGDAVGRLGGDEFAFVLSNLTRPDDAALVAQKVVTTLAAPFRLEGQEVYVSASLGIGIYPGDGTEADTLLRNADTAMYRAKEQGRNTYQFYLPQMNEQALERLQLQTQLRGALERGEFVLHYQPKANLASGAISGFEALLRWQHPVRGLVPPLQFISILEETGLIVPVGDWVVRTVCEQLARWQAEGAQPRPVAVNLSARQFQQKDLDSAIANILLDTGIDPGLLEFELTESMLMQDPEEAVRMLKTMRSYGVRLSVDDFGTGYSSLAYLKRFPLDALKIDRAFIRDVTTDPDDASIALAIISLAHSLKLKVVAEGVETESQLAFLSTHGCDEMQGYYFARPLPVADCTRARAEDRRLRGPTLP